MEIQHVEVDEIKNIKLVDETQEGKIIGRYLQIKYTSGDSKIWTGWVKNLRLDKNGNITGCDVVDY